MIRSLATAALLALMMAPAAADVRMTSRASSGAVSVYTDRFAQAISLPLGGLYRWLAANPQNPAAPTLTELQPLMFAAPALLGYTAAVSGPVGNVYTVCVSAVVTEEEEAAGFAAGAGRAAAVLANPVTCLADNGASLRGTGFPRRLAMIRQVDRSKVLSVAQLPAQPLVTLPAAETVELTAASLSQTVTVLNNTEQPLSLMDVQNSASSVFVVGSSCQVAVPVGQTCDVEVTVAGTPPSVKRIARLELQFSNGLSASFSARYRP